MATPERKPLAPAPSPEATEPHSIRFTPTQWAAIVAAARRRGEEPSRFVRRLTMYALSIAVAQAAAEEHIGITAGGRL